MKINIISENELEKFCNFESFDLDRENVKKCGALESVVAEDKGNILARASLWNAGNKIQGKKTGYIGHFAAENKEAGLFLTEYMYKRAKEYRLEYLIGPLDGNTWQKYRFITGDNKNPFFLEPYNPPEWPEIFMESGYEVIAEYYSVLVKEPEKKFRVSEKLKKMKFYSDLVIKKINKENFDKYINEIYDMSIESFKDNFLYSEISREDFISSYMKIKDVMDCDFIYTAYKSGKPAGFVFGIPDYNEMSSGNKIETVILKTLAVNPEYQNFGLGTVLLEKFHETAVEKGYKNIIHALIHKDNMSGKISGKYGEIMRTYHLYGRVIS
ncbi:GNAT family N-acetyltransferase [Sebaldella sp. S0638]|uniref:GNAT family N-acetyltransferase n=1 Tax=Sebaldella sp. S0638 TaxID=2957809 RepID=UPI0020A07C20|nr:GNAT family N-acetyltransferase [Sebaldella sp. S0638]MCP1222929.1 GNAT family N-acetyltransferase [Sebaldella sp. S0638]